MENKMREKYSLMNKIFKVYMVLMFFSCFALLLIFVMRFSSVYHSQAKAHMNDVTVAAETGISERIAQIDQLSVSILINNGVQDTLKEINRQTALDPGNKMFQNEKNTISREIRGSVFNISGIVSVKIYSLDGVETVIGSEGKKMDSDSITREQIYEANGGALWAVDHDNGMIGLYRAILSVNDFLPIGHMVIECKNSYFSEKLQSVPNTYKNRFYLLDEDIYIIASSEGQTIGTLFPLDREMMKSRRYLEDPGTKETSYFTYQYLDNGWVLVSAINVVQLWKNIGMSLANVVIIFGALIFISIFTMKYAARAIMKPTQKLMDSMRAYQKGDFDSRFEVQSRDEISQIGMVYNQLADRIQNLIEKNYTLEIANREAEIEFLKMQINPHFLYNCLDTISWLGFIAGNREVTDLTVALGKFLRASIKREDYYTVRQEMEVIDNYLFIQKYRFEDKIEVRRDISEDVLDFYMPSFLIQPIIENSIVHGLEDQVKHGILWISISRHEEKYLLFHVRDNGKGMSREELEQVIENYKDKNKKNSIGLSNVYRRLNILYGSECRFQINSSTEDGTEVSFRIPVMRAKSNEAQKLLYLSEVSK